jgi:hypothetical protein
MGAILSNPIEDFYERRKILITSDLPTQDLLGQLRDMSQEYDCISVE